MTTREIEHIEGSSVPFGFESISDAKAPAKAGSKLEASIAKATAVKEAQMVAAENMQKLLADNGIEKTLEECFEAVKVQA